MPGGPDDVAATAMKPCDHLEKCGRVEMSADRTAVDDVVRRAKGHRESMMVNRCGRGAGGRLARVLAVPVLIAALVGGCGSESAPSAWSTGDRPEYEGPYDITQDNVVIEGMKILHPLIIKANNVVIRNCLVRSSTTGTQYESLILVLAHTRGTVIEGNDIRGPESSSGQQAVNGVKLFGDEVDFSNNEISQVAGNGIVLGGTKLRVVNNYVHGFVSRANVVSDAVVLGGQAKAGRVLVSKNRLEMWMPEGMASLIRLPEIASNIVVSDNWLAGGSYAIVGGGRASSITGNRFSARYSRHCGRLGTHSLPVDRGRQGIYWRENHWADGPTANQEIGL
jgi:hypothetical protein